MGRVCIRSDFVDSFCIVSSLISKYKFNSWICSWKRLQLNLPQDPILLEAPCKLIWGQLWTQLHPQRIQLPAFIVPTEKSSRFYDPIISDHKHGVHITAVDGATQMQSRLVYAFFSLLSGQTPDSGHQRTCFSKKTNSVSPGNVNFKSYTFPVNREWSNSCINFWCHRAELLFLMEEHFESEVFPGITWYYMILCVIVW